MVGEGLGGKGKEGGGDERRRERGVDAEVLYERIGSWVELKGADLPKVLCSKVRASTVYFRPCSWL